MIINIKNLIPLSIRRSAKLIWHRIRPPRIVLTDFAPQGCKFEITSRVEKYRVQQLGDEGGFLKRALSEICPGDVFFDIGSCVGLYAIHAALFGAKVVAFEPAPGYRERLIRNIKLNKLEQEIYVIDWAVSNREKKVNLYTDGVDGNSPSLSLVGDRGVVSVNSNTIDNAVFGGKLPKPDLIKLDIEGAEILALQGMEKVLSSQTAPRYLFIEFHPVFLEGYNSSVEECKTLIHAYGYTQESEEIRDDQIHCIYSKDVK